MESLLWICQSNQQQMKLEQSFTASQGHIAADEIILLAVGTKRPSGSVKPCPPSCHQHRDPCQVLIHSGLWGYGRDRGDGPHSLTPVWKWIQYHSLECICLVSPQAAQLWARAVMSVAFIPRPSRHWDSQCKCARSTGLTLMFHQTTTSSVVMVLEGGRALFELQGVVDLCGCQSGKVCSFVKWLCVV